MRWEAAKQIIDMIAADETFTDVTTSYLPPGDALKAEHVWTEIPTGELTIPHSRATTTSLDDIFAVPVRFVANNPQPTPDDAVARLETFIAAATAIFTADQSLDGLAGVISAWPSGYEGPTPADAGEGYIASGLLSITVHARTEA